MHPSRYWTLPTLSVENIEHVLQNETPKQNGATTIRNYYRFADHLEQIKFRSANSRSC